MANPNLTDKDLREVPQAVAEIVKHRRIELAKVDALDPDYYGVRWKAERRQKIHENASETLGELREAADAASRRIVEKARKQAQSPKLAPDAQLAQAITEQMAWTRLERQLGVGFSPQELILEAARQKDVIALRVLRAELPSFLAAEQGSSTGGRQASSLMVEGILGLIDAQLFPHLPESEQNAITTIAETTAGMTNVKMALDIATSELGGFASDQPQPAVNRHTMMNILPSWDGVTPIFLDGEEQA